MPGPITYACYYCGATISDARVEFDHFPVPQHLGGEKTVPACQTCHDMKDRFRLNTMSDDMVAEVVADFPHLSRASKIVLARVLRMALEAKALGKDS